MGVTYSSSNAVQMMTDVAASLNGQVSFSNADGQLLFIYSSSLVQITEDGALIIPPANDGPFPVTVGPVENFLCTIGATSSQGVGSITNVPCNVAAPNESQSGASLLSYNSSGQVVVSFLGAVIMPPQS